MPGGNPYYTYLITTQTNMPEYGGDGSEFTVRRRFNDVSRILHPNPAGLERGGEPGDANQSNRITSLGFNCVRLTWPLYFGITSLGQRRLLVFWKRSLSYYWPFPHSSSS